MAGTLIGKFTERKESRSKVTGTARYVADIPVTELRHAAILRSSFHHACILSINTEPARASADVIDVITIDDVPGEKMYADLFPKDRPVLAMGKVRFLGEPVAIVVAHTRSAAEEGCRMITIEYEELPPVHDTNIALQTDAPRIHPEGNLLSHFEIHEGDSCAAFSQADVIVEETFHLPRIYPAYLETESAQAVWHEDGSMTVWVSSQKPFQDRAHIAMTLGIPQEKVQVLVPAIGGAFGGKEDSSLPMLAALAAWKIKGSVRLVNTRPESMLAHPKRHPGEIYYRLGARSDGTLLAMECRATLDTGAYASYGPAVGQLLTEMAAGPYRIPNVQVDTFVVYTNGPISGAMRGFGVPQVNLASESMLDMLAAKIGISATELRRKNIWKPGDSNITRVKVNQAEGASQCLEIAIQEIQRLKSIPPGPGRLTGVGMAMATQTMGLGHHVPDDSTHRLEWLADGHVRLYVGAPELGQGINTIAAQIAADELGLDFREVEIIPIDTDITPDGGVSCASRMTYMTGNAVRVAAKRAVDTLLTNCAVFLGQDRSKLVYKNGQIFLWEKPNLPSIPASEITSRMAEMGETLAVEGTFTFPYGPQIPNHLPIGMPHVKFCLGAHVARVEVDLDLGNIEVSEVVAIHDVGRVINRGGVEGQIEGGVAMAIGFALQEEMVLKDNGRWVENFSEYLLPTILDVPPLIKIILLENPEATGPEGAKGIGEIALVPTPAAIANAVFDATSKRVTTIPIRPEHLM